MRPNKQTNKRTDFAGGDVVARLLLDDLLAELGVDAVLEAVVLLPQGVHVDERGGTAALVDASHRRDLLVLRVGALCLTATHKHFYLDIIPPSELF